MNTKKEKEVIVEETCGTKIKKIYYNYPNSEYIYSEEKQTVGWNGLKDFFLSVFLPHGYPESVSEDYCSYQIWDSIQAFASSITGGIATHAILKSTGVGDENATVLGATMTWIIKDGVSMIGKIAFSWLRGTHLDSDCKKWRLFADVFNDFALLLDLISVYFKDFFLYIICISGLMKAIVGVAGGATRAALIQHQALQNNMADVSAKDGSQETLLNLMALICNLIIIPIVADNHTFTWLLYILMTVIHITANFCCVKSVVLENFNKARFEIFVDHYLKKKSLSIKEINKKETVWISPFDQKSPILLGTSFFDIIQSKSSKEIKDLLNLYRKHDYLLWVNEKNRKIYICLNKTATALHQLQAMFHAHIILQIFLPNLKKMTQENFQQILKNPSLVHNMGLPYSVEDINPLEKVSKQMADEHFSKFKESAVSYGWSINSVMFNADLWYVKWEN